MEKPHLTVSAAIIFNDARDRILITQRNPGGLHGGLWEFPGGKVEPNETPEECLHREILEELDIHLFHVIPYTTVAYEYAPFTITLHTFTALIEKGEPSPVQCRELRWVTIETLPAFPFPEADREVTERLVHDFHPAPQNFPVTDILDLHTFHPRDVKPLLNDYLEKCGEKGFGQVRIIHGKGTGTLKKIVRGILEKSPLTVNFYDAPEEAGGWGATIVEIRPNKAESEKS